MLGFVVVLIALMGWSAWRWLSRADWPYCGKQKTIGRGGFCSNCGAVNRRDAL
jgi:hypothetical protein